MWIDEALQVLGLEVPGVFSRLEIRSAYLSMSKKYHPDVNPAGEYLMRQINNAYDALLELSDPIDCREGRAKQYEGDILERFSEVLQDIAGRPGLEIELCGSWIWITGNTKEHKEALKAAGCRWSPAKPAWYWHPPEAWTRSRGKYSLDDIRVMHGSQSIRPEGRVQIRSKNPAG